MARVHLKAGSQVPAPIFRLSQDTQDHRLLSSPQEGQEVQPVGRVPLRPGRQVLVHIHRVSRDTLDHRVHLGHRIHTPREVHLVGRSRKRRVLL